MGGEGERHEQLRRRPLKTDRRYRDDGDKGGDRTAAADERAQSAAERHDDEEETRDHLSLPALLIRSLPAHAVTPVISREAAPDDEQARDENDRPVTKSRERRVERNDTACPKRDCRPQRHDDDRQLVPHEQCNRRDDDGCSDLNIAQGSSTPPYLSDQSLIETV